MVDYRDLPPITKAEQAKITRPDSVRQSLLAKVDTCLRSAFLYLKYDGGLLSHANIRGSLWHELVERAKKIVIEQDESLLMGTELRHAIEEVTGGYWRVKPDFAKKLMWQVIIDHPELPLPEYEQDAMQLMAYNWATATVLNPDLIVGVEQKMVAQVGDWQIHGTLDLAEISPFGFAQVKDYKTSLAIPSQDEIERGRKSFQGKVYAFLMLFGKPENEEFGLGEGIEEVRVELAYPRYVNSETGELIGRETVYERSYLDDNFRRTLESHLQKLERGLKSRKWQAVAGDHCSECPAEGECPIPSHLRTYAEVTPENVEELATKWDFTDREQRRLKKSLRAYADEHGPIYYGKDLKLDFRYQESREWSKAIGPNGLIDPEKVPVAVSSVFEKRRVKPDEDRDV